jgi:hypothetical protein
MKPWYKSRTFWTNVVSLVAIVLSTEFGITITAEEVAAIMSVINIILRALTSEGLVLGEDIND